MKFTIDIDNLYTLEKYLSILSLGILDCLEKNILSYDDAMDILYRPGLIDKFEEVVPDLGNAIHLGTELENVFSIIPDQLKQSIEQIRLINIRSIQKQTNKGKHIFYYIDEE